MQAWRFFGWDTLFRLVSLWRPGYAERLHERRGEVPAWPRSGRRRYWLHAASLGEMRLALHLEKMIAQQDPEAECVITAMTPSGSDLCVAESPSYHVYLPYDSTHAINAFLERVAPDALILIETELWPRLLSVLKARGIPVYVANGRLSPRSWRGCSRWYLGHMDAVRSVIAQSEDDAARFRALGVSHLWVAENLKCCLGAMQSEPVVPQAPWTFLAVSVQQGERSMLQKAWEHLEAHAGPVRLCVAPRRMEQLAQWCEGWGDHRRVVRASCWQGEAVDVLIIDRFGVLDRYYPLAHVVFVGGSWVAHGGQNVLEPARYGLCITMGPSDYNFKRVVAMMKEVGALAQYQDVESWIESLLGFYTHPERAEAMGRRALRWMRMMHQQTEAVYERWLQTVVMGNKEDEE